MTNPNDDSVGSADVHRDPLASHIDGFAVLLRGQGYVAETVRQKCVLLADLSQWLGVRGLPLNKLDEALVAQFHTDRCPRDRQQMRRGRAATTSQILNYLRDLGCIPTPSVTIGSSPVDVLLGDYEKFLRSERGLAPATLKNYLPIVQRFLVERSDSHVLRFDELRAADLHGFIAAAMPGVANWRLSHLPKTLPPHQVEQLLASCDRDTPAGQRDYAILLLLARLGLRGGEVVAMTLDDLIWECGEIVVRGKGQRLARMPLPPDVGSALANYLRHVRPACATRRVFVRMHAPLCGLRGPSTICCIVRRALKRAGVTSDFKGAHLLRHSLTTDLLRRGASLDEIGQLLRHSQPMTTQIYAKVHITALRSIGLAWPGAAS
jgi:integrase